MESLQVMIENACEASDEVGYRRDYSGRGMMGRTCVGITGPQSHCMQLLASVIGEMIDELLEIQQTEPENVQEFKEIIDDNIDTLLGFEQDSMGYDVIMYWRSIVAK